MKTMTREMSVHDLFLYELRETRPFVRAESPHMTGQHPSFVVLFAPDGSPLITLIPRRMGFRPPEQRDSSR